MDISLNIFEGFMSILGIMPIFWKYVLTFGIKEKENEFDFPGFGRRKSRVSGTEEYRHGMF